MSRSRGLRRRLLIANLRNRWYWLMGGVLLVLILPSTASAYPGERDAMTNPLVRQTVQIGLDFWLERGVWPCLQPQVMLADSLWSDELPKGVEPGGRAELGGCRVWIAADIVASAQDIAVGGNPTLTLCSTMVHELGHTSGMTFPDGPDEDDLPDVHAASGLMSWSASVDPWACRTWARKIDRRKERAFKRKYGARALIRRGVG
jgi:hypothetical protein